MNADIIEFIDVDIKSIKNEPIEVTSETKGDLLRPNPSAIRLTKCGEIFTANQMDFVLICGFCEAMYRSISDFGNHLKVKHVVPPDLEVEQIKLDVDDFGEAFSEFSESPTENVTTDSQNVYKGCSDVGSKRKCVKTYVNQAKKSSMAKQLEGNYKNKNPCQAPKCTTDIQITTNIPIASKIENPMESNKFIGNPDLYCEICRQQYKLKLVFRHHAMEHDPPPEAFRKDPYSKKCCYCDVDITNLKDLLIHEKSHKEVAPYRCPKCPKRFKYLSVKEEHAHIHTGERPFKCDQCSLAFAHSANLHAHKKRVHLKVLPFDCEICGKKFPQKCELNAHIRRHTGEKPYQCEKCGKGFALANVLHLHQKRHSNTRDKKCTHCPMTFFTTGALINHTVKHSTEKPFACDICGNMFKRRKALSYHMKLHQDVKEYVCNICGREFAQPAGLYSHKKSHLAADVIVENE